MLVDNMVFTTYDPPTLESNKQVLFENIMLKNNTNKVQLLCQYTNMEIYRAMTVASDPNANVHKFGKQMLTMFQSKYNSAFDLIFKVHFVDPYENTIGNRYCRLILVNILKRCFTDVWRSQVIHVYQHEKLTFMQTHVTSDTTLT